jgi:hypothetical protein
LAVFILHKSSTACKFFKMKIIYRSARFKSIHEERELKFCSLNIIFSVAIDTAEIIKKVGGIQDEFMVY